MVAFLEGKSLRFWLALSIAMMLAPIGISAVGGYFLLNHGVIASFRDVLSRERQQVDPTQKLRLLMLDAQEPVDEMVVQSNPIHNATYRAARTKIEAEFARLAQALKAAPAASELFQRARSDWIAADHEATTLISVTTRSAESRKAEMLERFHGNISAASDELGAVYDQLDRAVRADHAAADLFYERSIWVAAIAGSVSLLIALGAIFMIGRIISGSVDRLVDGAARFAHGDRDHRIDVVVPPELHRVAEEFNHMIGRIRESETILADLAQRDGLTGLANRRAFDTAMLEFWARFQRFSEHGALLAIDIDHFKRINDTYGHAAGDEVLRMLARTMANNLRPFDNVFRVGGEEFSIILPKVDSAVAHEAAERIREAIARHPVRYRDAEIRVTVSIGVALTTGCVEPSGFAEAADAALYRAKSEGRNRVVLSGDGTLADRSVA